MFIDEVSIKDINYFLTNNRHEKFAIDIGCSNNSYILNLEGYTKIYADIDMNKIGRYDPASRINKKITPLNVLSILAEKGVPENFSFLNLDIDGYDLFVLKEILSRYKPYLICTEINEKIPPPIRFTVLFNEDYSWNTTHFYGYSIACLDEIISDYGYDIVKLEYNNCFLIKSELNTFGKLSINDAYQKGYAKAPDREQLFYYNTNVQYLLEDHTIEDKISFINNLFVKYNGKYTISGD